MILSAITSLFGGFQGRILAYGLAIAVVASCGAYAGYRWEASKVAAMRAAAAVAQSQAVQAAADRQARTDKVSMDAAVAEAEAQAAAKTRTVTITKEIPHYVTSKIRELVPCIPYGLVRLLDAAALQTDPATLGYTAGQFDDTCSPLTAASLAETVIENYGAANANAEQLNALEAWIAANHKAELPQ